MNERIKNIETRIEIIKINIKTKKGAKIKNLETK